MDLGRFVEETQPIGLLGVKVSQRDALIGEWHLEGECRRNIYSASKSFTACAVGFAVQEGLLSLSERLTDVFPNELPTDVSENLRRATVRDLLTMCLGQREGSLMGEQRPLYEEDNWVKLSLSIPFTDAPGTRFVYSNVGPYLAGVLVQRRAGCDLVSYLTPRLFSHLGIKRPTWESDPLGNTFGAGGLFLTLSELHRFGLFCLNEGGWGGRQLLSPEWLRECARPQADEGYGYLFWRGEYHSYRADGKYCQLSVILPERQAVVTTVAECRNGKRFHRALYDEICPQL